MTWDREGLQELAEVWLAGPDRASIARASDEIEKLLGQDVFSDVIPLSEGMYRLTRGPIHVLFSVREEDRIVEIHTVRLNQ